MKTLRANEFHSIETNEKRKLKVHGWPVNIIITIIVKETGPFLRKQKPRSRTNFHQNELYKF